jgi:FtsH-binding integral membrane protein
MLARLSERRKKQLDRVSSVLLCAIAGALLFELYVEHLIPGSRRTLATARVTLQGLFWAAFVATAFFRPKRKPEPDAEPSPRASGVALVVLTGSVAAIFAISWSYYAAAAIAAFTCIAAVVVWRFATSHADQIGEARFTTTTPSQAG